MALGCLAAFLTGRACASDPVYEVIYRIVGPAELGSNPISGLLFSQDGYLYGTTQKGGTNNGGTVYRLRPDGTDYRVILSLKGGPEGRLVEDSGGTLYGTTPGGGTDSEGSVFKVKRDGSGYAILHSFTAFKDRAGGFFSRAEVLLGQDGLLYGTTEASWQGRGIVYRLARDGSGFLILHSFVGGNQDGADPKAGLVQAANGRLYGTTSAGGPSGLGTVYGLNPDGSGFEVLYSFDHNGNGGGEKPKTPLLIAPDGTLWGTTSHLGDFPSGTIFRINPNGSGFAVVHPFVDSADPSPLGGMTLGKDGLIYGTTWTLDEPFTGTLYRMDPQSKSYNVLHSFSVSLGDGTRTTAGLVTAPDGQIYGTNPINFLGFGTIFRFGRNDGSQMAPPKFSPDGAGVSLSFSGAPGLTYSVQRAASPTGPWATVGTVKTTAAGAGNFSDPKPPAGPVFYRSSYP